MGAKPLTVNGPKTASAVTGPGFASHHRSPRVQLPGPPIFQAAFPDPKILIEFRYGSGVWVAPRQLRATLPYTIIRCNAFPDAACNAKPDTVRIFASHHQHPPERLRGEPFSGPNFRTNCLGRRTVGPINRAIDTWRLLTGPFFSVVSPAPPGKFSGATHFGVDISGPENVEYHHTNIKCNGWRYYATVHPKPTNQKIRHDLRK